MPVTFHRNWSQLNGTYAKVILNIVIRSCLGIVSTINHTQNTLNNISELNART